MKKIFALIIVGTILLFVGKAFADEPKTNTPRVIKYIANEMHDVYFYVSNFITNEVIETKEYQKVKWEEGKEQLIPDVLAKYAKDHPVHIELLSTWHPVNNLEQIVSQANLQSVFDNQNSSTSNGLLIAGKYEGDYSPTQIVLPSAPRTLTQSQIYTINEINKSLKEYF